MLCFDRPAPHVNGRADDAVDAKQIERHARADDVGDRIGGADFVEMDALDRLLVDLRFGLAELAEYRYGVRAGLFG